MGWTRTTAAAIQDDQFGVTARTAPTTPMKLHVETVAGDTTNPGTELASTTWPTITMGAASGTPPVSQNSASCSVTCGASGTCVAIAIYDSAVTPVRKARGPMTSNRTVASGDTLAFAQNAVSFTTNDTP